jgi:calcium-dependent protein kinase
MNYNKLVGTSYYIAPEVIAMNYDERCDIWSAGIILYMLTTAMPPFDGDNDRQIMERVKKLQYTFDRTPTITQFHKQSPFRLN